jgi:hypothetical protein
MTGRVIYGNREALETKANGVEGVLCRSLGGRYFFRVATANGEFTDYQLLHDDLKITISSDQLASFYTRSDANFLDHGSSVLKLKSV